MWSRLVLRSKEVDDVQLVQQTANIVLTLPPTLLWQKNRTRVLTPKSVHKYNKKSFASSFRIYHVLGSLCLVFKWTNMWSNGFMKSLPCVFQERCPALRFTSKILSNRLGIAPRVS